VASSSSCSSTRRPASVASSSFTPAIGRERPPLDQAPLLQAVDDPGHVRRLAVERLGRGSHRDRLAPAADEERLGLGQLQQRDGPGRSRPPLTASRRTSEAPPRAPSAKPPPRPRQARRTRHRVPRRCPVQLPSRRGQGDHPGRGTRAVRGAGHGEPHRHGGAVPEPPSGPIRMPGTPIPHVRRARSGSPRVGVGAKRAPRRHRRRGRPREALPGGCGRTGVFGPGSWQGRVSSSGFEVPGRKDAGPGRTRTGVERGGRAKG